ncbi:MAG: hypothetical protein R2827_05180 [Bdellovibrionales bacterium]
MELPKNSPLDKTREVVKVMSHKLVEVSEDTFDNVVSDLGTVTTGGFSGSRQSGSHLANDQRDFHDGPEDFYDKEKRIVDAIRKAVREGAAETGAKTSVTLDRPGPPIVQPSAAGDS